MPCPCKRRELFTGTTPLDLGKLDGRYQREMRNYQPYYDEPDYDPYYYQSLYHPLGNIQPQVIVPMQTIKPIHKNSRFICCICLILILIIAYSMYKKSQ